MGAEITKQADVAKKIGEKVLKRKAQHPHFPTKPFKAPFPAQFSNSVRQFAPMQFQQPFRFPIPQMALQQGFPQQMGFPMAVGGYRGGRPRFYNNQGNRFNQNKQGYNKRGAHK